MKITLIRVAAMSVALIFVSPPLRAHHGWAAFTSDSQITLKGTVIEFHFVNPHSVVEFQVTDAKGQKHVWEGELTSRSNLTPRGWTPTALEDKEEITVTGYPARNGSHAMRVTKIVLSNGKELKPSFGN
jgi:hypothetical protein